MREKDGDRNGNGYRDLHRNTKINEQAKNDGAQNQHKLYTLMGWSAAAHPCICDPNLNDLAHVLVLMPLRRLAELQHMRDQPDIQLTQRPDLGLVFHAQPVDQVASFRHDPIDLDAFRPVLF